ncbi:MAG: tRNA adenosine(34) deaminase TadA [Clostridia bacterium]|nr:tRNA adenosine(34) deaminase TadA [Clostridia bacterium]
MKKDIIPIKEKSTGYYMRAALRYAKKAADEGEVPVGAVVVYAGHIIAGGRNRRENGRNALYHAELEAIDKACKRLGGWRLFDCDMYVTLEPCPMCAGALINSRMRRVYIGAADSKAGCFGSIADMNTLGFNHKPEIVFGVLEEECSGILKEFFRGLRERKKEKRTAEE